MIVTRQFALKFARYSIFLIYFWFGALKVAGASSATPLVLALLGKTISFMEANLFMTLFGLFEMFAGVLFLCPKLTRPAVYISFLHIIVTFLPLLLLPDAAWQGILTPSLEGQYILKNILLISVLLYLWTDIEASNA